MKPVINFSLLLIQNILIIIIYYKSYLISLHTTTFAFLVQDIVFQLQRLVSALARYHNDCHGILKEADVFPIEVCSSKIHFVYVLPKDLRGEIAFLSNLMSTVLQKEG